MNPAGDQRPEDRVLRSAIEKGLISKEMADAAQREGLITQTRATELLIRRGVLTKHIVDNLAGVQPITPAEPVAIAGFKIIGQLGKGGMGTVYKALQVSMNREVALKVIARQFAEDPAFCERFLREARAAGAVNHPNVITCYDVGQDQEWLYMALELMTGGDASSPTARADWARSSAPDSSTATSSRPTSSSPRTASPSSATSGWRARPPAMTA